MKIPSDKQGESQYMLVGMSKKMYKEMVKEINIIGHERRHPNNNMHQRYVIIHLFFYVH
jgi:hypothetical protein